MPFKATGPTGMADWANAAILLFFLGLEWCLLAPSLLVTQRVTLPMYKTLRKRRYLGKPRETLKKESIHLKYPCKVESRSDFRGPGAELTVSGGVKDEVALAKFEPMLSGLKFKVFG